MKKGHECLTWKTQMWEKPRQSTNCRIHYMWEEYNNGSARATTSSTSPWRHTRRLQDGGNYLSLSLSLSLHTRYTTTLQICDNNYNILCPKSYLYLYDFSAYLHMCPSNRSEPIGAGSEINWFSVSSIRRDMLPNMTYTSDKSSNAYGNMDSMPSLRNVALIITTWNF